MKVLVCDDNPNILKEICSYLSEISKNKNLHFDISTYKDGDSVLATQASYDIAFIDIEMPGVNGLTVTKHLKNINNNIIVFIITSFQGYLDDAMDLSVFRYITKPIDKNRFFKSMDTALYLYRHSTEQIIVDYFDECHAVHTIDILYLAIDNRKTKIVTKKAEYLSIQKFDYWKKHLESFDYFAQPHYSFIVNLKNVTDFNKTDLYISSENKKIKLPVSRNFYSSFKKSFYDYMGVTV